MKKNGVASVNIASQSSALCMMARIDSINEGEARQQTEIIKGSLSQEPKFDAKQTVREAIEQALEQALGDAKKHWLATACHYLRQNSDNH